MAGDEGSGATDPHHGSVFRVGETVELTRVLTMISTLIVCIMLAERVVHKAEHRLRQTPKYHEMLTKVLAELTILGFIGLGIKILKEVAGLDAYSKSMVAFQAADMTIFLVAIALILQAIVVSFRIHRKNIQVDKAELISTQHLVDLIARTRRPTWWDELLSAFTYARRQSLTRLSSTDLPEVARLRILRHFFLKTYGLPELFPFSKYLRQAQDNQIARMIEVKISMWMILVLVAWGIDAVATSVDHAYRTEYSIVVAFLMFTWVSVVVHVGLTAYFTWSVSQLLDAAVEAPTRGKDRYLYLNEIADHESGLADRELATDAIATMERVREREQRKRAQHQRLKRRRGRHTGSRDPPKDMTVDDEREVATQDAETGMGPDNDPTSEQDPTIKLRWFSPRVGHFVVMTSFMLNALYLALFCQCVIFRLSSLKDDHGKVAVWGSVLPLIFSINFFQSRILRNYILVSSIVTLDDSALSDVIDHFTETVELRAGFVKTVHEYLAATNQSVADIQHEFEALDPSKTGMLDAEDVRLVLRRFGFELSYYRFNSVAKLLFELRGMAMEYAQVVRLLELGRRDDVYSLARGTDVAGDLDSSRAPLATSTNGRRGDLLVRAKSSSVSSLYRLNSLLDDRDATQPSSPSGGTPYMRT